MPRLKPLIVAGLTMLGPAAAADAAVLTFTDQAAWQAALGGATILTETFDGAASNFAANSNGNPAGLVTVDVIGHENDNSPQGETGTGFFVGEVDSNDPTLLRFNRPNLLGFALLDLQPEGATDGLLDLQEIGFEVAGESFLLTDILGLTDPADPGEVPEFESAVPVPFVGFIVDSPVDSFVLQHGDLVRPVENSFENFLLDGLLLAEADDGAGNDVPAPATLMLLGIGLAGLGIARRRLGAQSPA